MGHCITLQPKVMRNKIVPQFKKKNYKMNKMQKMKKSDHNV